MNAMSRAARALPDAREAEEALLGAILIDNSVYWRVAGFLKPEHFRDGEKGINGPLYSLFGQMISEGRPVTPITVKPYVDADSVVHTDQDGTVTTLLLYIIRLQSECPGTFAAYENARAIIEMWARHRLIGVAQDLESMAWSMPIGITPEKIIGEVSGRMSAISREIEDGRKAVTMSDAVEQAVQAIDAAYNFRKPAGILTGIEPVDQLTGPWEPGQQIVIGGGTKQGKTALALQIAVGLAAHGPVWVYSGEMSFKQLAMREIARRTGIPVWRQKEGRIAQADWDKLAFVRQEVAKLPIVIEKRRLTLEQIHQHGREMKMEKGLAAMVVDHVGLLAWGKENARRDEWEQSQIATRELKAIYEDLGIPGASLVQLKKNTFVHSHNGSFASRLREAINRRPKYTDLMGAVERDADHVLIPFNARPIIAGLEPEEGSDDHMVWEDRMREHEKKAEIILALSREQSFPARRSVEWHGETTSFGPPFQGKQESLLSEGY